jgi:hypothetical protein
MDGMDVRNAGGFVRPDKGEHDPLGSAMAIFEEAALAEAGAASATAKSAASVPKDTSLGNETTHIEHPSNVGLFQDIPSSIWRIFLAGWAGFFLLMWFFFAVNASSTFVVTVAILFGAMAFGLPIIMAKQSNKACRPASDVIDTHTGPVSVGAATAQIALIPIAVFLGFLGFILFAK